MERYSDKELAQFGERIKSDEAYLSELIDTHVVPNLDFESMTKLAVAKAWRSADDAQRTQLVSEFKQLLLNTYTDAMTQYSGESIEFQPFRPEKKDDRAVVRSVFKQAGGGSIPVLYKLRNREGWLIYDIEVDQISLVTSYRTAFANEIEKGGIDGLLDTLKEKNAGS
jgi:phospholipid transport system substrate-binding protein